jgi:hypothetical protein
MTHEVIGQGDTTRISIILRDELEEDRVQFGRGEERGGG